MRTQFYVGCGAQCRREVFKAAAEPTRETHGEKYFACIGPFRTKRGARFMAEYGQGNPHCVTVGQAERLAKKYATEEKP